LADDETYAITVFRNGEVVDLIAGAPMIDSLLLDSSN